MSCDFAVVALRFRFRAEDPVVFPEGKSANILRGAFGLTFRKLADESTYSRLFEPRQATGPSGFGDLPRPFVFRASHLDGRTVPPGECFEFRVNVFEESSARHFAPSFAEMARVGIGPGRGRGELIESSSELVRIPLDQTGMAAGTISMEFVTPMELKSESELASRPEFGVLFARARDRVSTLRAVYGEGPLEVDFRELGERARAVRMTRCEVQHVAIERRSSRTRQVHPIGGFIGFAEYEGALGEFLPVLKAAEYTGIGRQTVWGKGEVRLVVGR